MTLEYCFLLMKVENMIKLSSEWFMARLHQAILCFRELLTESYRMHCCKKSNIRRFSVVQDYIGQYWVANFFNDSMPVFNSCTTGKTLAMKHSPAWRCFICIIIVEAMELWQVLFILQGWEKLRLLKFNHDAKC